MAKKIIRKEPDNIGFRVGAQRRQRLLELTKQANYQKPNQFIIALIDQLGTIDGPFDVRGLRYDSGVLTKKES